MCTVCVENISPERMTQFFCFHHLGEYFPTYTICAKFKGQIRNFMGFLDNKKNIVCGRREQSSELKGEKLITRFFLLIDLLVFNRFYPIMYKNYIICENFVFFSKYL